MSYFRDRSEKARSRRTAAIVLAVAFVLSTGSCGALAGGPKFVAGVSFFNPGAKGQPVHWANGQVRYFVDQGPLNSQISNSDAIAMVDAAAAVFEA